MTFYCCSTNQKYSRFQTRRRALCCLKRSYRKSRKVSVLWFTVDVFDLTDVFKSSFCLCAGKVGSEDEVKEEFKEESDPPATHEEGSLLLHSLFISSTHPFLFPFPLSLSFLLIESRLLKPASLHHFFLSGSFSRWREAQRGSHWSFVSHFQRSGSQYGWPGFCEVWTEENVSLCSKAPA